MCQLTSHPRDLGLEPAPLSSSTPPRAARPAAEPSPNTTEDTINSQKCILRRLGASSRNVPACQTPGTEAIHCFGPVTRVTVKSSQVCDISSLVLRVVMLLCDGAVTLFGVPFDFGITITFL
jgi:hypothetical protein